jgi:hypothetical protein
MSKKSPNVFRFELNDFDPMDGFPIYLPKEEFRQYMGMSCAISHRPTRRQKIMPNFSPTILKSAVAHAGFTPRVLLGKRALPLGQDGRRD